MINFKNIIAEEISKITNIEINEISKFIEVPKESENGDYAFPCFKLAKTLKKSPNLIADDLKLNINIPENIIEKIEVVGGYLNFFINKETLATEILSEVTKTENYGKSNIGEGKNIVIDYSSPNIAKTFHIGHLRTTVIGASLYNIYKYLGYNVTGINHIGDYGTQFGKLIEGYKRWGSEYNLDENPIEKLTEIYVRISNLCKEDESVLEDCRNNFKKLEDGDKECVELWTKFKDLSLKEFQKVYDILGIKFDSWNGEAFYTDKMQEVIDLLQKSGKLIESQGARIIDLEEYGMAPCLIQKSNGSSTYATRDLAAILYRARTYDYDKALYVTSYEQTLHFKQVFQVAKLLGLDKKYTDGLEHISYGMVLLETGKMSTRDGNVVKLEDLLNEAIERAKEIINEKNPKLKNKDEIAKKVGVGAVVFNDLSNNRVKDEIFNWDRILSFQGETGPYLQYTYVRTKSIIEKAGGLPSFENIDKKYLLEDSANKILKILYNFEKTLIQVTEKNEPCILSRYLIDLAKAYSNFYNENQIITKDKKIQNTRIFLTYATGNVLKIGAKLLGMEMPDRM